MTNKQTKDKQTNKKTHKKNQKPKSTFKGKLQYIKNADQQLSQFQKITNTTLTGILLKKFRSCFLCCESLVKEEILIYVLWKGQRHN